MAKKAKAANHVTVKIHDTDIAVLEYQGKRVVTFAMVDQLHQRPERTARRNFDQNKNRFVENSDFYRVDSKGLHEFRASGVFPKAANTGIVLTETGYLMLVKSFTDDLAWEVQRELVKVYFRAKADNQNKTEPDAIHNIPLSRIRSDFRALAGLHRDFGLDKNQALLAAEKVMIREFGIEVARYLALPGQTETQTHLALPSPVQERFYNPTEIGARLTPVQSAIKVNRLLLTLGLQVDAIIGGRTTWALTESGEEYGRYLDVGKAKHDGTPIQQIRWRAKTGEILQAALNDVAEGRP